MQVTWAFLIVFVAAGDAGKAPETFILTVPEVPVSAPLGSSVILPCAVSPTFSVVSLEIRWHRPKRFRTPVLLYENKRLQQDRGRVSLVGNLEQGNVSIKLENITLGDRGRYVCNVHSEVWFQEADVTLNVEVIGTPPLLSVSKGDEGQVKVSCTSDGWSPQPALTWTGGRGEKLIAVNTVYTTGAVIGGIIGGVVFIILVILIPTAVLLYRKGSQGKRGKKGEDVTTVEEGEKLMEVKDDALTVQGQMENTTTRMKQNEDALTVQKKIKNTATKLKDNDGVLGKLKREIEDTQNLLTEEDSG